MSRSISPPADLRLDPSHPLIAGRTGRGVGVAVIDSGIHPGHPHVGGLRSGIAFDADGQPHGDVVDRLGHGTAVASAIHEKAPDAEIHVARVFEETLSTSIEALVAAIEWAVGRAVKLVNLSLGAANPENAPRLLAAVERAAVGGAVIVSAVEDGVRIWYPGSLPGVVGVTLDWSCPRDAAVLSCEGDRVRMQASGYARPIPGVPPDRNVKGISFAVANATGILACALEGSRREPVLGHILRLAGANERRPAAT